MRLYEGPEKRRSVRWYESLPVEYVLTNNTNPPQFSNMRKGVLYNISANGICMEIPKIDEEWKVGLLSRMIKVALEVKFPKTNKSIIGLGGVIWMSQSWEESGSAKDNYMLGLEFIDVPSYSRDIIREYIIRCSLAGGLASGDQR
jgi:c-di-GMP-binding flagellar brake protein YcgR